MTVNLGKVGIWLPRTALDGGIATEIEAAGYGAIWIGSSPEHDLHDAQVLLEATSSIAVATGIVSIWMGEPAALAASYHRLADRFPDRFLLGIGVAHPENSGQQAERPYGAMVEYLDGLDDAGVPVDGRVLAALGPRMLRLSAVRARGAHPYLAPVSATAEARETVGPDALLAPEQRIVVSDDLAEARSVARRSLKHYLELQNYRRNFLRRGFTEADLADGGSDALVDSLAAYSLDDGVARRVDEHLAAGADHVALQVLTTPGQPVVEAYRLAAQQVGLVPVA
jgi:probable F420-dependent oxidoreductase